ncbi:MAG TPA: MFS transporter, partial [Chroococcidiopsis sp.]
MQRFDSDLENDNLLLGQLDQDWSSQTAAELRGETHGNGNTSSASSGGLVSSSLPTPAKPVVAEPAVPDSPVTESAVTEPMATEPVVTELGVTEPGVTEPGQNVEAAPPQNGLATPDSLPNAVPAELTQTSLETSPPTPPTPPNPPPDTPQPTPDQPSENGFLPVLRNRDFLALWAGQVFSQLADKVYLVLMIMLIDSRFQRGDQSISGWVSSIMIAFTIPAVLFGSVAGVFVDHWSKKAVLVVTNLLRGGLVLAIPVLLWLSSGLAPIGETPIGFALLLAITFLISTLTQFFAPAEQSAIPSIVERRHLLSANSLYTTTMMASVIIGFAVGEPLLAIADHLFSQFSVASPDVGKELLVGTSYGIAGLLLLLLRFKEKADEPDDRPMPDVVGNIRDGFRFLKQQPRVRAAMLQLVILFSLFAALAVLAVRLAEVMPAIKSSQFGFLLAAGGVGMAIGAVVIGHSGQRIARDQLSLYGSIGVAACLISMAFVTTQFVPTLFALAGVGGFSA